MKIVQLMVIGTLQGPVRAPKASSILLDSIQVLMRMLEGAGIVLGSCDADELFNVEMAKIRETTLDLFTKLTPLVGSVVPLEQTGPRSARSQTGSSQYASATSDVGSGSDSATVVQRMPLGPTGADMLRKYQERSAPKLPAAGSSAIMSPSQAPASPPRQPQPSPDRMHTFFNAVMEHFLKEQQAAVTPPDVAVPPTPRTQTRSPAAEQTNTPEAQDVDMKSVESRHPAS
jgi:hypothetical protein